MYVEELVHNIKCNMNMMDHLSSYLIEIYIKRDKEKTHGKFSKNLFPREAGKESYNNMLCCLM